MSANPAGLRQPYVQLDDFDLEGFLRVATAFGSSRFAFVVTPNVDHMIRCHEDAAFQARYASADFALLDSRFAAQLLRLVKGLQLPVCTGSDLTEALFRRVIAADDRIVLVGGSAEQAGILSERFGLRNVRHYNPPMGFITDPAAVEECVSFIEQASPFRFCFLAVGSPQQELVAALLRQRGTARGLALCVGGALNFLTGGERRAPLWMQRMSLEWLYRLARNPRRLWVRYLVRGPRIFGLLRQATVILRKPSPGLLP